jgi:eukaryotic-like serine/threonine-protein kinase
MSAVAPAAVGAVPVAPPLAPGTGIAPRYRVVSHLHRSRLLDTYDLWSDERECRCVGKTLRPDRAGDARARRRLVGEGRLLARLTHPHIVRAYDTLAGEQPLVVLETLGGETLDHLVRRSRQRLDEEDLVVLGLQLGGAVRYLHAQGYLHLDLKPANVVIAEDGRARVLDLSLARPPGPAGPGVGTRPYQSPEQARGGVLGPPADVWGIGAVLWEAATASRAFPVHGDEPPPQLDRRAEPVRRRRRRLSAGLAALIDACLEPEASGRPAPGDLLSRLKALHG